MRLPRALLVLGLLIVTGCSATGTEPGNLRLEINAHHAMWAATRPGAYTYVVARGCFCSSAEIGPVRIRVVGDSVVSRTYTETGDTVLSVEARFFPAVDGLFDVLEKALADNADSIDVTWGDRGVPVKIAIDQWFNVADDEVAYIVQEPPSGLP